MRISWQILSSCVVLVALAGTVYADEARPVEKPVEYKRTRIGHRGLAKGFFLGSAVGIGASIGLSLYEKGQYNDAVARNDNDAANHAASMNRWVGTSLFLAGVACLPVGIVLWIQSSTVVLTPITTPSGGGAALSLRF